ncbi:hypothetical protein [Saccharospirillum salsuginis]|uniref:DUF3828 domain-containing protein n=1 Tax=Saccharospirillum salsuginis TaxID=418750 RepID=A0A918K891_9GAMM|nr:hypothetical protein [Saccharospirillum salsuginis]GGX54545.1 hypothetical protein GCM10007392_22430 [Saccharospirillum salsuginis]
MKLTYWFTLILLVGCASTPHSNTGFYETYKQYQSTVQDDYESATELITDRFMEVYNKEKLKTEPDRFFPYLEHFPTVVMNEEDVFESQDESSGCLTVVGTDNEGEPASISIQFVKAQGLWLMNAFEIGYYERRDWLPSEVVCPEVL